MIITTFHSLTLFLAPTPYSIPSVTVFPHLPLASPLNSVLHSLLTSDTISWEISPLLGCESCLPVPSQPYPQGESLPDITLNCPTAHQPHEPLSNGIESRCFHSRQSMCSGDPYCAERSIRKNLQGMGQGNGRQEEMSCASVDWLEVRN